jgi:hypothetical protein
LRVLLSFAVGCLLADVFLHLLPEVWVEQQQAPAGESFVAYCPECTAAGVSKLFDMLATYDFDNWLRAR